MIFEAALRRRIKASRKKRALWVRILDRLRLVSSADGRSRVVTLLVHGRQVHQASSYTEEERYPELFDAAARIAPDPGRILSFGCSTGAELAALRRRFPRSQIVGAEINARSRAMAGRRVRGDPLITVVPPSKIAGTFDMVFALAVLQRDPYKIAEMAVDNLERYYPFQRFDSAAAELAALLRTGGSLCVINAHYRMEDCSASSKLIPIEESPRMDGPLFGPNGDRLIDPEARTMFRKV